MKALFLILSTLLILSCTSERIYTTDIDKLIADQVENNEHEIQRIKNELNEFKIDKVEGNVDIVERMDILHAKVLKLIDSLDYDDKGKALKRTVQFIDKNFTDLESYKEAHLRLDEITPRSLLKLRVCILEAFYIRQQRLRYDFEVDGVRFNYTNIIIRPTKTILKKGEKLTGELFLGAESNFEDSQRVIRKMIINGKEVEATREGWTFEFVPNVNGPGMQLYELRCEAILHGKVVNGHNIVYVQN